jgi:hypothetical protein
MNLWGKCGWKSAIKLPFLSKKDEEEKIEKVNDLTEAKRREDARFF